jgi:hypothetical protein
LQIARYSYSAAALNILIDSAPKERKYRTRIHPGKNSPPWLLLLSLLLQKIALELVLPGARFSISLSLSLQGIANNISSHFRSHFHPLLTFSYFLFSHHNNSREGIGKILG